MRRGNAWCLLDLPALKAYYAGSMKKKSIQYTIRNIPPRVDQQLREQCALYKTSLNERMVDVLIDAVGLTDKAVVHHDLDDLVGTWVKDDDFDQAIKQMDRIDRKLWK